jgi:hypothetical protein
MHGYTAPGGPWCGVSMASPATAVKTGDATSPVSDDTQYFIVYPNPTQGQFTIEQKGDASYRNIRVDICNMMGNKVYSSQNKGLRKMACNLADNSPGLYHIRVNADGKVSIFKLILTR